jgi:hypothetical protein
MIELLQHIDPTSLIIAKCSPAEVRVLTKLGTGGLFRAMGNVVSPRGDMPKNRVPLFKLRTPHVCLYDDISR